MGVGGNHLLFTLILSSPGITEMISGVIIDQTQGTSVSLSRLTLHWGGEDYYKDLIYPK